MVLGYVSNTGIRISGLERFWKTDSAFSSLCTHVVFNALSWTDDTIKKNNRGNNERFTFVLAIS